MWHGTAAAAVREFESHAFKSQSRVVRSRPKWGRSIKLAPRLHEGWRAADCSSSAAAAANTRPELGPAADIFCHRSKYFYIMPYSDYWAHFPYLRFINICTFVDTKMHNILIRIQVSDVPSVVLALGWHGRLLDYLIKSLLMWILTCWHYSHGLGSSEKNNIYVISSFPSHWKIIRCRVDNRYLQKYSLRTISVYSTCKKKQ